MNNVDLTDANNTQFNYMLTDEDNLSIAQKGFNDLLNNLKFSLIFIN